MILTIWSFQRWNRTKFRLSQFLTKQKNEKILHVIHWFEKSTTERLVAFLATTLLVKINSLKYTMVNGAFILSLKQTWQKIS